MRGEDLLEELQEGCRRRLVLRRWLDCVREGGRDEKWWGGTSGSSKCQREQWMSDSAEHRRARTGGDCLGPEGVRGEVAEVRGQEGVHLLGGDGTHCEEQGQEETRVRRKRLGRLPVAACGLLSTRDARDASPTNSRASRSDLDARHAGLPRACCPYPAFAALSRGDRFSKTFSGAHDERGQSRSSRKRSGKRMY